jgi:hypothetical protein
VIWLEEEQSIVMSIFSMEVEICVPSLLLVATDPCESSQDKSWRCFNAALTDISKLPSDFTDLISSKVVLTLPIVVLNDGLE